MQKLLISKSHEHCSIFEIWLSWSGGLILRSVLSFFIERCHFFLIFFIDRFFLTDSLAKLAMRLGDLWRIKLYLWMLWRANSFWRFFWFSHRDLLHNILWRPKWIQIIHNFMHFSRMIQNLTQSISKSIFKSSDFFHQQIQSVFIFFVLVRHWIFKLCWNGLNDFLYETFCVWTIWVVLYCLRDQFSCLLLRRWCWRTHERDQGVLQYFWKVICWICTFADIKSSSFLIAFFNFFIVVIDESFFV